MSGVFYYKEFNDHDLDNGKIPLREKCNEIIKDLEENKYTNLGGTKLIKGDGDVKYFRAKLSDSDRLLFTSIKHNNKDAFIVLEVILNHDYQKSKFLKDKEKIKNIKITDQNNKEVSDTVEIEDTPQARWLGKFITLSAKQEDIVKDAEDLPLIVSGSAGSGKTSVALEKFRKIEEKFEAGKVLYITQSENLIKQSKELYEYVYWDETTNDFKIGIPERIEFLSLHEFLEKRAEDIKGKKPISRDKFFSWFNEICKKDKFKEYKKDGDKIFEEFTAVIAGGGLKEEEYKELGSRQAIFSKEKRDTIYSLFEKYKEFIEKDSEYYDPNLTANECTEEKIYDAVVVDEVQDLTESTLNLILKSLKDESKGNFLLCGDVNQVIHPSFFSKSRLKSFASNHADNKSLSIYNLQENYRSSQQVIELANRVLHLKNYCFASEDKLTPEKKENFFMVSNTKNIGNVSFIADDKKEEIAKKVSSSINWAILVLDDKNKESARELFGTPLVFNVHEAKGLEFKNVVLYEFISHGAYNGVWNIAKNKTGKTKIEDAVSNIRDSYDEKKINTSRSQDKKDKSFEEFKFYINALYVAISRAINDVYIIGNEKKCNLLKVIKSEERINIYIKQEESTPEEWRNKALELIDKGNIEQAKSIAETKLLNKEYAEEIMKKLETKEYRAESDKDKQELKTEPQKSSTMVPNEKRKQSASKKKKLTKWELERNTDKLFLALKNGSLRFAEQLIEQGVNVNARDKEGFTALYLAAKNGYISVVQLLLDNKAEVNARYSDEEEDWTVLHEAIQRGDECMIKILLGRKADVNAKADDDITPLYLAARLGYTSIVKLLLGNGADVNAKIRSREDCSYVDLDDASVRELFLQRKARVDDGFTPLDIAVQKGYKDVVELLRKYTKEPRGLEKSTKEENTKKLFSALDNGDLQLAERLIRQGVDINAKDQKGCTPLHLAAKNGCTDVAQLLLDRGAVIDAQIIVSDSDFLAPYLLYQDNIRAGSTPLHVAAQKGEKDIVELLLNHGARVNIRDQANCVPLHLAAKNGCDSAAKLLLDHGADVNAKSTDSAMQGYTPLHVAARNGHVNIAQLLLDRGADVNSANIDVPDFFTRRGSSDVWTPLHLAASNGHLSVAQLLLDHGANVHANNFNHTPLHSAAQSGRSDIVKFLLSKKADINAKCKKDEVFLTSFELALLRTCSSSYYSEIIHHLLTDININVGCIKPEFILKKAKVEEDKTKFFQKRTQDKMLFCEVEKAANEKDTGKLDKLLKEIGELLETRTEHGFKPSLNYSPDGSNENTTINIAIKAGGKLLQLLCDYAEKHIGTDTEIFKRLKQAIEQERPQSQLHSSNVSRSENPGLSIR